MFNRKPSALDEAISDVYSEMKGFTAETDEYAAMVKQLTKLEKLRHSNRIQPSLDTVLIVGGNLLGIVAILHYEKTGVVVSKALNLLMKIR